MATYDFGAISLYKRGYNSSILLHLVVSILTGNGFVRLFEKWGPS